MTQYTKPTVLPAWGESAGGADVLQPSNAEIQAGWPLTNVPPSRKRFNWILKYLAQGVRYLMQMGVPLWDAAEDYPVNARVMGSNGKTYRALQTSINQDPTTATAYWAPWGADGRDDQLQLTTAFTTAGTAPNFTLTPVPAPAALAANLRFRVKFHAAGAGADQINIAGLGNKSIKQYDSTGAKVAATIVLGQLADIEYDGTDCVILDPLPPVVTFLPGMRNRIINGNMIFDQRNLGAAVTPTASSYTLDRWNLACTQASKLTVQRVTDAPAGSTNSLKVTVAAQYAPLVTDIFNVNQPIEGNNIIDLQFGTAGALQITTSFQVKASVAGTYSCAVHNGALNRSYVATYTIPLANTWTPLVITISGDQTGTWATDNTTGLWIDFDLGSGTNFNTTAGAWAAGNLKRTSGSVTFVNQTAGATWQLAQVQIERGAVIAPIFEPRNAAQEELLCLRYAYRVPAGLIKQRGWVGSASAGVANLTLQYPVPMRVAPTIPSISWSLSQCTTPSLAGNYPTRSDWSINGTVSNGSVDATTSADFVVTAEL